MPDASVKGKGMVMEVSPVSGRYYGKTGEKRVRGVVGKPDSLLVQRKAGSLHWKIVKFSAGNATAKQYNGNNPASFFVC